VELDSSKTGGAVRNQFGFKSKQKLEQLTFWDLSGLDPLKCSRAASGCECGKMIRGFFF
jgi:hypothetical protein